MFFGSYPIVVEGDTELAAFIAAIVQEDDELATQITVIPARGKALIAPLVQLLTHFQIPFGVLHDTDGPMCEGGGRRNSAWAENGKIASAICAAREKGIEVRHRVSVPDFERSMGDFEGEKDKPLIAHKSIREKVELKAKVRQWFADLLESKQLHPIPDLQAQATSDEIVLALKHRLTTWAGDNAQGDLRYKFPA